MDYKTTPWKHDSLLPAKYIYRKVGVQRINTAQRPLTKGQNLKAEALFAASRHTDLCYLRRVAHDFNAEPSV